MTQNAVPADAMPSGVFGILFAIGDGRPSGETASILFASTVVGAATLAMVIATLFAGGAMP